MLIEIYILFMIKYEINTHQGMKKCHWLNLKSWHCVGNPGDDVSALYGWHRPFHSKYDTVITVTCQDRNSIIAADPCSSCDSMFNGFHIVSKCYEATNYVKLCIYLQCELNYVLHYSTKSNYWCIYSVVIKNRCNKQYNHLKICYVSRLTISKSQALLYLVPKVLECKFETK